MVPTRVGTYHIAVHAYTAFGPSKLEVTVGGKEVESYDVDLVFREQPEPARRTNIVRQAAERWEEVIGLGVSRLRLFGRILQPAGDLWDRVTRGRRCG